MISVVVPAYNAERWLEAAVASVMAQTVSDWELVLVDDGSTDRTPVICDSLGAGDRRIRVLHTSNGGLSVARNNGIELASGEWLAFLDADDLLHPQFMETMLAAAERTGADIVNCGMLKFEGCDCPFLPISDNTPKEILDSMTAIELALYQRKDVQTSASGKIYRRELWKSERFTPGTWYEDLDIFYRIWSKSRKFVQVNAEMYGYRQHPQSFLHRFTPGRMDMLRVTERLENWIAGNMPRLLPAARDRRMSANFNMFLLCEQGVANLQCTRKDISEIQRQCFSVIRERRRQSLFGRHTRTKNRLGALVSYFGPTFLRLLAKYSG